MALPLPRTRRLAAHGAGLRGKLEIARASLYLSLLQRGIVSRRRWLPITLTVRGEPRRIHVTDPSDLMVLRDVLVLGEYAIDFAVDPETIVDLGSHAGFSVLDLADRFPRARIVAVEADPRTLQKLRRNVEGLAEVVHAAAAPADGTTEFLQDDLGWLSKAVGEQDAAGGATVRVPALSLESICRRAGVERIDLLKIDIEGAEWDVLTAYPRLGEIGEVVGELHEDLIPVSRQEFFAMLGEAGFEPGAEREEDYLFHVRNPRAAARPSA